MRKVGGGQASTHQIPPLGRIELPGKYEDCNARRLRCGFTRLSQRNTLASSNARAPDEEGSPRSREGRRSLSVDPPAPGRKVYPPAACASYFWPASVPE